MRIGIIGAMPEEMEKILAAIPQPVMEEYGKRKYYCGKWGDWDVVGVFSRWGKVASAATVTELIVRYAVDKIVFVGIAGAVSPDLNVGDVVVASGFYQHDMDARPLMPRFELPLTGKAYLPQAEAETKNGLKAVCAFLENAPSFRAQLSAQGMPSPKVVAGDMASGDLFISSVAMRDTIRRHFPSVACVDMESAAVAQVCDDYDVPLLVIRVMSDAADEHASVSASDFVLQHGGDYLAGIVKQYVEGC